MKYRIVCILLVVTVLSLTAGSGSTAGEPNLEGIKCVLSGEPAKANVTSEFDEYTVYFCCNQCVKAFNKDQKKHAAKALHQIVATKQAKQETCPKSGKSLNPDVVLEVDGVDIAFCCRGCKSWATKLSPDARIARIFDPKVFAKNFSRVTKR